MSRQQRLHVPGGTYYVIQRGNAHRPLFTRVEDYSLFERLLASALRRAGARLHGYCWLPGAIHLVVQIEDISIGRIMQGFASRYARSMQQRVGESGHFFRQRYRATLIDTQSYLPQLIRHIHMLPQAAGLGDHPFSSHHGYQQPAAISWLTTRTMLRILEQRNPPLGYAQLMAEPEDAAEVASFAHGGPADARVIGSADFVAQLPRRSRPYRTTTSLDQVIGTVTCRLGVERERVLSTSRERDLALARALIAWYATERGIATLSEVARRLRRDPSTLSMAISRYRVCRAELFKLTAVHDVVPLAPIGPRAQVRFREKTADARE